MASRGAERRPSAVSSRRAKMVDDLVATVVSAPDGSILGYNRAFARLFDFESLAAAESASLLDLFRRAEDHDGLLERLERGDHASLFEWEALSKAGRPLTVLSSSRAQFDSRGEMTEVASAVHDVTARKVLAEQLVQAQRMEAVGELVGGVAHDFNNLLTALLGYVYLAEERMELLHSTTSELAEIRKAAERAASLTHQLLAFSQRQAAIPMVLDLVDAVGQVEGLVRSTVSEHTRVEIIGERGVGTIRADPSQIEQILVNLAVNAHDAMPTGGRLTIEIAAVDVDEVFARQHPDLRLDPGSYVRMSVSDTGVGMTPEIRRRAFEPFFTTKDVGRGTGLGLATVYGIVRQNGGQVSIYSEPGRGSTFRIYFPRVEGEVEYEPVPVPAADGLRGSETILVVEDEPAVREILRQSLMKFGYRVVQAESGTAALEVFARFESEIDLLLLDVIMPGLSGPDLARELLRGHSDLKVLFMSGWPREAEILRPTFGEIGPLLEKPFTTHTLMDAVRRALGGH